METEQKKQEVQEIENAILDSIIEIRSDPVVKDETENFPWTMYVSKKDTVTMYIDGFAESAAAILAFTGDELVIREHSSIMFHNIHTGGIILQDSGKIKANIESMHRVYKHMLETFCSSVLTSRQINNIIKKGSEVYYSGAELLKKLS